MSKCRIRTKKNKTRPIMNYEWIGKPFRKKSDPENRKNRKKKNVIILPPDFSC